MADQDRLQQLREQRAAIAKHLAWLDTEISREAGKESKAPRLKLAPKESEISAGSVPTLVQRESDNPSPAIHADPDAVLEEWTETQASESGTGISKTGCWVLFAALALLGIGGVVLFVLLRY